MWIDYFSREESRMHIHVLSPDGEAKFWMDPIVSLADFAGFSSQQIKELAKVIEKHAIEIKTAWNLHFPSS